MAAKKCTLCDDRRREQGDLCKRCYYWMAYHKRLSIGRTTRYIQRVSIASRRIKGTYGARGRRRK